MNSDGCGRLGLEGVCDGGGKEMEGEMLRNVLNATCLVQLDICHLEETEDDAVE